jgi:hypothetical protein
MEPYMPEIKNTLSKMATAHPDKGFENDLMGSSRSSKLINFHYQQYVDIAKGYGPNVNKVIRYVQVGVNKYGRVITPFEEGGLHVAHPFAVSRLR